MNRFFLFVGALILFALPVNCTKANRDTRPEVALCSTDSGMGTTLFMVFDLNQSGLLGNKSDEEVILTTPSVEFNPWTYFDSKGNFGVVLEEKNHKVTESTTYGGYRFENIKTGGAERTIPVFSRKGAAEYGFGSAHGPIIRVAGSNREEIGKEAFATFVDSDGKERNERMTRLNGDKHRWVCDRGGKIMQLEDDKKLSQVGWVAWRKITTPKGEHLAILMTKSMDKNAKWGGRYDGKLYREK